MALERDGLKIRTRALTTTLFARLLIADAFVHGIGGGLYDELTDELMTRLFGLQPPAFLVVTGTLHLPLPRFGSSIEQLRMAQRAVRDLDWNPQRHLDSAALRQRHAELLTTATATRRQRRARFEALRTLNGELRPMVSDERHRAAESAERGQAEVHANAILGRRDYSFVLHPEEKLQGFLTQAAQQ
jgi:hypothetical protein